MESRYVGRGEAEFPEKLVGIKPDIMGLWGRGDWELLKSEKTVAIVGSRKMTRYGKQVLAEIVPKLVDDGYTTISGFMYGIDIEMHRLTIENGGKTIGVFGWGIDSPVIPGTEELYHKALDSNNLFVSELEPTELGQLWTFPRRNRIVVGLSDLVIVVEAGIRSGSLNSAEWGRKLGKPVYAVPGPIFSPVSAGCNWLLSEGFAKPLTLDFFDDKNYSEKVRIRSANGKMSEGESRLITQLKIVGPRSLNELARTLEQPVGEVSAVLTGLLLKGEVTEERGIWSAS